MVKMRRIKLFEGFNDGITEQEIRGALVELVDDGYNLIITETSNGYSISIGVGGEFFNIKNVSEPILELIDYLTEKYGKKFVYSIEYNDYLYGVIDNLELFVKDNPLEDTDELRLKLIIKQ